SAATGHAFAVMAAYHEASIEERWNHSHTFGRTKHFLGDAIVGRGLDFIKHGAGSLYASGGFGGRIGGLSFFITIGISGKNRGQETYEQQWNKEMSHYASLGDKSMGSIVSDSIRCGAWNGDSRGVIRVSQAKRQKNA